MKTHEIRLHRVVQSDARQLQLGLQLGVDLALVFSVLILLGQLPGANHPAFVLVRAVLTVGCVAFILRRFYSQQREERSMPSIRDASWYGQSKDDPCVYVIGRRARHYIPDSPAGVSSPPEAFRLLNALFAQPAVGQISAPLIVLLLAAWLGLLFCVHEVSPKIHVVVACVSAPLTMILYEVLWARYIRCVPGGVDILEYSLWKGDPTIRQAVSLEDAIVIVDTDAHVILIASASAREVLVDVSLKYVPQRKKILQAVVSSAVSRRMSVRLPTDSLLG